MEVLWPCFRLCPQIVYDRSVRFMIILCFQVSMLVQFLHTFSRVPLVSYHTPQRNSSASYLSDDYSVDTLSCVTDFDSSAEMARQPRSTASALLRYRGIVSPPSSKTRKSNMIDSCLSSQLSAGVSSGNEPWEMLRSVCAEPSKKFATVHHLAKLKVTWEALAQSLIHSIRRYDRQGSQFSTLCSLLIARGDYEGSFAEVSTKIEDKFRQSLGCVQWNPFPVDFWISV